VFQITENGFLASHTASYREATPAEVSMPELADKTETGSSFMFIGLALWVAGLLVVFFLPAAIKIGRHGVFLCIISLLALGGIAFMVRGLHLRGRGE
jgi:hypothetical protein